jgi:hypothetical protein
MNTKPYEDPAEIRRAPTCEEVEVMMSELRAMRSGISLEGQKKEMDFHVALKIAEGVMDKYRIEQPKWWKRMDGTPMLNDIAVRMAMAFLNAQKKS